MQKLSAKNNYLVENIAMETNYSEKLFIRQVQCTVTGYRRGVTPILLTTLNVQIRKTFAKKSLRNEKAVKIL